MKSRLLPLLALVLAIVIFFVYTKSVYDGAIAEHRAAIASNEKALAAAADFKNRTAELEDARSKIDSLSLAKLERMVPDSVNNVRTILDIDALARGSGITLQSIDVSKKTEESADGGGAIDTSTLGSEKVGSVMLSLKGFGTYAAFKQFLASIEGSERLLDVTRIDVTTSESGVYSYAIDMRLYWLR